MKKATGIISIIGCSLGIILCCYVILPRQYSDYKKFKEHKKKTESEQLQIQAILKEANRRGYSEAEKKELIEWYLKSEKKNGQQGYYSVLNIKETVMISCLAMSGIVFAALGIYYVLATRFGTPKLTVLDSLEKEIGFIKKQIERKELLAKLKNIENSKV